MLPRLAWQVERSHAHTLAVSSCWQVYIQHQVSRLPCVLDVVSAKMLPSSFWKIIASFTLKLQYGTYLNQCDGVYKKILTKPKLPVLVTKIYLCLNIRWQNLFFTCALQQHFSAFSSVLKVEETTTKILFFKKRIHSYSTRDMLAANHLTRKKVTIHL